MTRPLFVAVLPLLLCSTACARRATEVVVFSGFGTPKTAMVSGRVQELSRSEAAKKGESRWSKLKRNVRMWESDELEQVKLKVTVGGKTERTESDDEGLFSVSYAGLKPGTHGVKVAVEGDKKAIVRRGDVVVAPQKPGVAVISDIDDTVLDTGVTSKRKLIKRALFKNALDLRTFAGAPQLYRAWARRGYPVIYLSGSPINLYPQLTRFLELNRFPAGPLLLKKIGISSDADPLTEQVTYKTRRVEQVRKLLPGYRLILVGDAGEKDAHIYRSVAKKYPHQVVVIAIRKVDGRCPQKGKPAVICFGTHAGLADALKARGLLTAAEQRAVTGAGHTPKTTEERK